MLAQNEEKNPGVTVAQPSQPATVVIALLAGLAALGPLSTNIILPAFPSLATQFHAETRELGATLSAFFVAFAIGQLFVGPLSDRFGRRPLVVIGLLVFVVGTILCAYAETLGTMLAGRVIQALGVCAATVLSRAIARDLFEGETLARALALTMVATAAAPGFSPLAGSAMDIFFGWQSVFALVGIAAVLLGTGYVLFMGETLPRNRRTALRPAAVVQAYSELARDPLFILPALGASLIIGGLYTFFGAAPAILVEQMGLSSVELGLFFAATVVVVFGASLAAPRIAQRVGAPRAALWGAVASLLGGALLAGTAGTADLKLFSFAIVIFLLGMGIVNPLGTALALEPFGERAGLASALLGFLQMACAAGGTALAASLPISPLIALGSVMTGATLLAIGLFARRAALLSAHGGRVAST